MKALTIKARKNFPHFTLDVSWEMDREILVLFGPSGSGKSVTLQIIAGLLRPDEGVVASDGRVFFDSSSAINISPQKRSMGYVFQDRALFPHMTVKQNIAYGLLGADKAKKAGLVSELIARFHLKEVQDRHPHQISGGQKQRVILARTLIGRPQLLLLDEPFCALDNALRKEMHRLLIEIRRDFDIPIILVTHDLLEAYALPDKVVLYSHGQVAQTGTPKEIFRNLPNLDLDVYLALNLPELIDRAGCSVEPLLTGST
ncbi:MAG: sulfate/molybdate ABC transporter ATP-binding protein [Syntrophobacteraceae bacterium]